MIPPDDSILPGRIQPFEGQSKPLGPLTGAEREAFEDLCSRLDGQAEKAQDSA